MDTHTNEPSLGDDNFDVLRKAKAAHTPEGGSTHGAAVASDLAAIRRRVLGTSRAQLSSESLTDRERENVTDALRETMQVDLDTNETALRNLEDQNLLDHMAAARMRLAEYHRAVRALPSEGDLRVKFVDCMSQLSKMVMELDRLDSEASDSGAIAAKRTQAIQAIRSGGTPRNCPPNPMAVVSSGMFDLLTFIHAEAKKTSDTSITTSAEIKVIKNAVFKLRREVEVMGDGYVALVEALGHERRQLRDLLSMETRQ